MTSLAHHLPTGLYANKKSQQQASPIFLYWRLKLSCWYFRVYVRDGWFRYEFKKMLWIISQKQII